MDRALERIPRQVTENHAPRSKGQTITEEGIQAPSRSGPCLPTRLQPDQFRTPGITYATSMTAHSTPRAKRSSPHCPLANFSFLTLNSNVSFLRRPPSLNCPESPIPLPQLKLNQAIHLCVPTAQWITSETVEVLWKILPLGPHPKPSESEALGVGPGHLQYLKSFSDDSHVYPTQSTSSTQHVQFKLLVCS